MDIFTILTPPKTVAVIGLSDKPDRPSYQVAAYLQEKGFKIIPINPALTEVLGEKAYPSLGAIPQTISIDIVDVFRKPEFVPQIVQELIHSGRKTVLWLQEGVINSEAKAQAESAGYEVIMNACMMKTHRQKTSS